MDKAKAELILNLLEATASVITRNYDQFVKNAFVLSRIYPELDDFLFELAQKKQAETEELLTQLQVRIELTKLAIELFDLYPE